MRNLAFVVGFICIVLFAYYVNYAATELVTSRKLKSALLELPHNGEPAIKCDDKGTRCNVEMGLRSGDMLRFQVTLDAFDNEGAAVSSLGDLAPVGLKCQFDEHGALTRELGTFASDAKDIAPRVSNSIEALAWITEQPTEAIAVLREASAKPKYIISESGSEGSMVRLFLAVKHAGAFPSCPRNLPFAEENGR